MLQGECSGGSVGLKDGMVWATQMFVLLVAKYDGLVGVEERAV